MDFVAVQTLLTTAVDGGIIVCDLRWRFPHHIPFLPFFLLSRPFCGTFRLAWLPAPLDSLSSSEGLVKVAGYLAWTDDGVIWVTGNLLKRELPF